MSCFSPFIKEDESEDELPDNKYKRMIWVAFENPNSSIAARMLTIFSLAIILISIVVFCIESMDNLKHLDGVWSVVSALCNIWFTLEYVVRLICAKRKIAFLKGTLNIIDVLSILPFYVQLLMQSANIRGDAVKVFRVLRVVRVVRIFKLTRHSRG